MKSKVRNEEGFGIVLCLLVAGSLSLFLLLLGTVALVIRQSDDIQTKCHSYALAAQKIQAQTLVDLLALNPMALKLRKKRKLANKSLKTAKRTANPKLIAAATAFWLLVVAEQAVLRGQQNLLLQHSKTQLLTAHAKARWALQKKQASITKWKAPEDLRVKAQGQSTGSPTFQPRRNFEKKQTIELEWKAPIHAEAVLWIQKLKVQNLFLKDQCAATVKLTQNGWRSRLTEVKSSRRLSFL